MILLQNHQAQLSGNNFKATRTSLIYRGSRSFFPEELWREFSARTKQMLSFFDQNQNPNNSPKPRKLPKTTIEQIL